MRKIHACWLTMVLLLGVLAALLGHPFAAPVRDRAVAKIRGSRTVDQVLRELQPQLHVRIEGMFARAGLTFPPARLALLGIKDRQRLEVWAGGAGQWRHVIDYPFTAFSGTLGPKLREGDGQIPEGIYRIDILNPNSQYHLSMRVTYPNEFDRRMAVSDGRTQLGGDIYIHGSNASIGCIALGDPAIEDLFYIVGTTGMRNVEVILAPCDLRDGGRPPKVSGPAWVGNLHAAIRKRMAPYRPSVAPSDAASPPGAAVAR